MNRLLAFPWLRNDLVLGIALILAVPAIPGIVNAQDKEEPKSEEGEGEGMRRFWNRFRRPSIYQRSHDSVKEPFAAVVGKSARSTVRVLVDGDQAALGTVVAAKGLVLTKASELGGKQDLACELFDGRKLEARRVAVSDDYDLAMLKVKAENLLAVDWVAAETPVGAWLVTPGLDDLPVSIGVVSTSARRIPKSRALLGVRLGANPQDPMGGARVGLVFPNSGAERAGVEVGDVIVGADDEKITTPEDLISHVHGLLPGDRVKLKIIRGDDEKILTAELTDEETLSQSRVEVQNSLGGPISRRRSGFPRVIQHDSVLRPEQCGGPILNLEGKVVGLNIARAGRVASYAVPAADVVRLLPTLVSTMGAFQDQQLAQKIADLQRNIERWTQASNNYKQQRDKATATAKAAEGKSADELDKARKDVKKFSTLSEEATAKLKKLNEEASRLRAQQQATASKK